MAPWGSWGPEPPSEANNVVTGRDFTVVDLPADKINEREYGTASPAFTERHARKDSWGTYGLDHRPFQRPGSPREVPETVFKSAYELQVCARKMDEGHEGTDWEYLRGRVERALLKGHLWSPRQDTNHDWHQYSHVEEAVNGKANQVHNGKTGWDDKDNTSWDGSDNIDVNSHVNHIKIAKTYWNDGSNTDWNVNENDNVNADTNQAGNNKPGWDDTCVPRWNTSWDDKRNTNWGDESDSDSENARNIKTTPTSEIDDDCDGESDDIQNPTQLTPEFSSADKIISAIDRNTDVVADLCEIMEGLKASLDVLHEDNVKSKDLLQKLLNEQRAVGDKQT
ncbi:hypothetical protein Neosp_005866 [[Neocosmospora] mangrovei]